MTKQAKGTVLGLTGLIMAVIGPLFSLGAVIYRLIVMTNHGGHLSILLFVIAIIVFIVGSVMVGIGAAMKKG